MKYDKLPLSFARCLLRLKNGEQLNASEFISKVFLKRFSDDGVLQKIPAGNRRFRYSCSKPDYLHQYVKSKFGILSIEDYIILHEQKNTDGETSLKATDSTKVLRKRSLQGFFIKSFNSEIIANGKVVPVLSEACEIFVHDPQQLRIPVEALVVGVENPECFVKIGRLISIFPSRKLVFVMRYMSKSPVRWLQKLPNEYLHFGDFDPAGVMIYINEYLMRIGKKRCRFYVPENIEQLIDRYGSKRLYNQQADLLKKNRNTAFQPEVERLLWLLKKYEKGLEQERLLAFGG